MSSHFFSSWIVQRAKHANAHENLLQCGGCSREGEKMKDIFILIFSPPSCITDLAGGDFHSCCGSCLHNSLAQQSLRKIRDYW